MITDLVRRIVCDWLGRHRWRFDHRNPIGGRWWLRVDRCERCGISTMREERV